MNTTQGHPFRIQVERMDDATSAPLVFEVQNHDDIFAMALAVGLKLFTGVMLNHRHDPLFADVQPMMRMFIGNLKSRIAATMGKT